MLSYEGLVRLNHLLSGFYRLLWLNLLWIATTVVGLGIVGAGPATYAFAKYVDRWFRLGELPPVTATFRRYATELGWRPVLVSWVLLGLGAVIGVNVLSAPSWYLRVANLLALVLLAVITAYVYFVLAALEVNTIRSTLTAALLLGVGSLHWTIIGTTAVAALYWLMYRFALPLLPLVGIALPMAVVGLIVRSVFRRLAEDDAAEAEAHTETLPQQQTPTRSERNDALVASRTPGPAGHWERHLEKGNPR
ncbi:MAG TPA: DUF624 domain-containing protein [Candidatus Ruania gallistercoris]|uniref:DUF624 domain-containing protein n=1 Tax=Candidatus Ruania gallistercoris TaxID=2838746 RepID=A0A9D2J498_9MICO|nr:DUF624 domain-containing protein [Candidatus Ruania gallistercoris]